VAPEAIAADERDVWVGTVRPGAVLSLTRLDARTGAIRGRTRLGLRSNHDLALTDDAVWVTNTLENVVWRVSRDTGRIVVPIRIAAPTAVAAGAGAVWVVSQLDDALWRIDPATNLANEIAVGDSPGDVAAGAGAVWVAHLRDGIVTRVDPERRTVTKTIKVAQRVSGVAVAGGKVWAVVPERGG
jgi:streptogramin lyase